MNPASPHNLEQALQLHQAGRLHEAETLYRRVLLETPDHPKALAMLGMLALQTGHPEPARGLLEKSLAGNRRDPLVYVNYGLALQLTGNPEEAEASFRRAIKLAPDTAEAHGNLGLNLLERGRAEEAVRHLRRAVQLVPDHPNYAVSYATALIATGARDAAEDQLRQVLGALPDHMDARLNLAALLFEGEKLDEAMAEARWVLERAPENAPENAKALDLMGRIENERGNAEEAVSWFEKALRAAPEAVDSMVGLGNAYLMLGNAVAAIDIFAGAAARAPGDAKIAANLALAQKNAGRFEDAIASFERALALKPDLFDAQKTLALTRLTIGQFDAGLADYEARWHAKDEPSERRSFPYPAWQGEALSERMLLVWAEQGIGDHIFYAGMIPDIEARGGRCLFECDPRLVDIVSRSFEGAEAVPLATPPDARTDDPAIGYQIPMGGLLAQTRPWETTKESARPAAYLKPDPLRTKEMKEWLSAFGSGPKIGIAWRSARRRVGPFKSMPLDLWAPILRGRAASFINLQYGDTDEEVAEAASAAVARIHTHPTLDRFNDMDGLFALVASLDLVITTSNVTAHIAGALGKPCWVALQYVPLWYWGHEGRTSWFYPSIAVYRQAALNDWSAVVDAIAGDLRGFLERNS